MIAASVIMINRNGGAGLTGALRTCRADLETCWREDPCLELIVVDNGSTDDSLRVIDAELQGAAFPWRCVSEPVAGVNFSRNAGLRARSACSFSGQRPAFGAGAAAYLAAARANHDVDGFAGRIASASVPEHCLGG